MIDFSGKLQALLPYIVKIKLSEIEPKGDDSDGYMRFMVIELA